MKASLGHQSGLFLDKQPPSAHSSPPEVIQDLRTVCHDALPSAPVNEMPLSGSLQIRGWNNGAGSGPAWECIFYKFIYNSLAL